MQTDQQLVNQLRDAVGSAAKSLEETKQRHKARISALRAEQRREIDGIWYEGTSHMAAAYRSVGEIDKWDGLVQALKGEQAVLGSIEASSVDSLTTGFALLDGSPFLFYSRPHVAATAWLVLAERGVNPFWLGTNER